MTAAEKAALKWLDERVGHAGGCECSDCQAPRTLKAMLAEPRLPRELSDPLCDAIWWACEGDGHRDVAEKIVATMREYLTKPKTKTVELWHVEYSFREFEALDWKPQLSAYPNSPEGIRARDNWILSFKGDKRVSCIHVTGPHKQEVPNG